VLADALTETKTGLDASIDRWLASGRAAPPRDVTLYALYEQRVYLLLAARSRTAAAAIALLPPRLAAQARDTTIAKRELGRLTQPRPLRAFRTGPATPARTLRRHYGEAERRFRVAWSVLAAVNFVESAFGRLRNASTAGAQGPMQFLPTTWRRYGMGGDIHDPHDAILGAANFLRAAGAPGNYRRALFRYNPSPLYVDAVLRYARRIRADRNAFYAYYSWQVFVRTPSGLRRLTGPSR
jgi:membrane-bound lytic murein transglycosylase B